PTCARRSPRTAPRRSASRFATSTTAPTPTRYPTCPTTVRWSRRVARRARRPSSSAARPSPPCRRTTWRRSTCRGAWSARARSPSRRCSLAWPRARARMGTRDPEGIAAEVAAPLDTHGIDQFFVVDSVFNAPRGYAERVCAALHPLGRRIRWSCFVTPGNFSAALLDAMIAAGCQSIDFGTDAGSDRTLRAFRKSFNVDDIRAASAICRARGFPFCHSLVFGGEDESWETVAETIALMD